MKKKSTCRRLFGLMGLILTLSVILTGCGAGEKETVETENTTILPTESESGAYPYETAINNLQKYWKRDSSIFLDLAPEIYWEHNESLAYYDFDDVESFKQAVFEHYEEEEKNDIDIYGDAIITYSVIESKLVDERIENAMKSYMVEYYGTNELGNEIYDVMIEWTLELGDKNDKRTEEYVFFEMDGKWYPVQTSDDEEFDISFIIDVFVSDFMM